MGSERAEGLKRFSRREIHENAIGVGGAARSERQHETWLSKKQNRRVQREWEQTEKSGRLKGSSVETPSRFLA